MEFHSQKYQTKLFDRINYERTVRDGTDHFKLQSIRTLLERADQPHFKYPVIHVAGTKGKGSTATMIASILTAAGKKTGLYTSPHLETIRQRISIDNQWISNEALEETLGQLEPHIVEMDRVADQPAGEDQASTDQTKSSQEKITPPLKRLTFFEIITATAMLYFANQQCDAVVLEVGLGGRLDSTNVCQPDIAVITNISLDHTRQLGSTTDKIAYEKAGIIKQGIPIVSGATEELASKTIQRIAKERNAKLVLLDRDFHVSDEANDERTGPKAFDVEGTFPTESCDQVEDRRFAKHTKLTLSMLGKHQRTNAALAVATIETLNANLVPASGQSVNRPPVWKISNEAIRAGLQNASLMGRTEIASESPTIVLDIAHNVASIKAMLTTLQDELPRWPSYATKRMVFSTSRDKDCRGMLEMILAAFDEVILTEYDLNPRATKTTKLLKVAQESLAKQSHSNELALDDDEPSDSNTPNSSKAGCKITVCQKPESAWQYASDLTGENDLLCIAGSAFLIAELGRLARHQDR